MNTRLLLALLPLMILTGCLGKNEPATPQVQIDTENSMEDTGEEIKLVYIPSVIITPEAWYAEEDPQENVLVWKTRRVQFDEITFLGVEKDWTYKNSSGKTGEGLFFLCEVKEDDTKKQVWFFYNKVMKNARPGVIIAEGFLYEEPDILSILSDEVKATDLVAVDTGYSHEEFMRIRVPSVSESKDYYVEKTVVSTQTMDLKVMEILEKAATFGEGEEKVKRKLLLSAVDKLGGSALIDLVVQEINTMDHPPESDKPEEFDEEPPVEEEIMSEEETEL